MFKNIGGKIKTLAVIVFILEVIGVFFSAIWTIVEFESVLTAILTLCGGFVLAWISVSFIYGFGELIERTVSIDNKLGAPVAMPQPPVPGASVGYVPVTTVAPPVPAKPYYDISRSQKPSVGVGKCPICKQANMELWECVIKEGNKYSQKNVCQGCIDTYQKAAKQ